MKTLKKLLALCLVLVICFSLSGCKFIEDIKESRITKVSSEVVEYKGKEYKVLPYCEYLWFDFTNYTEYFYIVEDDVPILLTSLYGKSSYFCDFKKILVTTDIKGNHTIYAREDIYDDIINRIESENYFDGYCFSYNTYDKYSYVTTKYELISDEVSVALEEVITVGVHEDVDIELLYDYYVTTISKCSNDLYFKENCMEIFQTSDYIYIAVYDGEETPVYKVPEKYVEIITSLIDKCYES